jgi:phosphatidylinositol phospholipase C gamma-1
MSCISDKAMQINHAKFEDNGKCGYVLKPKYMLKDNYNPLKRDHRINDNLYEIHVAVISGHHIPKVHNDLTNISSPFVEIECIVNTNFEGIIKVLEKKYGC